MFYTYRQNNTHGYFLQDEYVGTYVIIEANDTKEANELAISKAGIYFDGVSNDIDCYCCGGGFVGGREVLLLFLWSKAYLNIL